MLKSLEILNNKKEILNNEWSNYLYNTKEKNYNVLNVKSLKEINNLSVFNYVKKTLEILNNIDEKEKLNKEVLYYVEETLKWQDVAKTGNKNIRKNWKKKGYNLYCHNIGSSEIYDENNKDEVVRILIKTHGLIGQYIKGEVKLNENIELYNLIKNNKINKELLKEVLIILNKCIILSVNEELYFKIKDEVNTVINRIINGTLDETIDYLNRLKKLYKKMNNDDIKYLKSLNITIKDKLNNLFDSVEVWYFDGALKDFNIKEIIKILLFASNYIKKDIFHLTFEKFMHSIYLDYKGKREINIYKKRIIENYLENISLEDILNNNISPNPHISYSIKTINNTIEFNFKFSLEARKLIEFCEVALTSDVLYQKATYMLYDLFGFRRDAYDRFYNELNYLNTMNSGKNEKAIILDYIVGKKVLDVGPGGGVLMDLIENTKKDYDIWGIDLSQNVIDKLNERKKEENHKWNIVKGDALNLTKYFKKKTIDTVIYSSIIHELYSYIEFNGKKFNKETIRKSLKESYDILKTGGRIIIRDGIMSNPITDYRLIEFKNVKDIDILKRYCKDFKGRNVKFDQINENTVKMLVNDAMEFLYTYTWGEQSYPLEVQEQFGYFTLNEYIEFIKENLENSIIVEAKSFLQEGYEKNLLNKISIFDENHNVVKLPDSTSLIVIEKGDNN